MKKVRDSRATILNAALQLFAERGYQGTSMRQIAKQANVSLGLVTQFYGTKDALHQAVDDHVLENVSRRLASIPDEQNFFDASYRLVVDFIAKHELQYRYVRRALIDGSPGSSEFFKRYHQLQIDVLQRAKRLGEIAPDIDETWAALILIFLTLGPVFCMHQIESIIGKSVFDLNVIAHRNAIYARLLQEGFRIRKQPM